MASDFKASGLMPGTVALLVTARGGVSASAWSWTGSERGGERGGGSERGGGGGGQDSLVLWGCGKA